jgi:hypothetical protein
MPAWTVSVSGKFLLGKVSPATTLVRAPVASVICQRSRGRVVVV